MVQIGPVKVGQPDQPFKIVKLNATDPVSLAAFLKEKKIFVTVNACPAESRSTGSETSLSHTASSSSSTDSNSMVRTRVRTSDSFRHGRKRR
jgi:hypothetical protein